VPRRSVVVTGTDKRGMFVVPERSDWRDCESRSHGWYGTLDVARQTHQAVGIGQSPLAQSRNHKMSNRSIYFTWVIASLLGLLPSAGSFPEQNAAGSGSNHECEPEI
jgi:hypothetical protein